MLYESRTTLTLIEPGDAGWDAARAAWNLSVDQRPAAVAMPSTADDVVAAVAVARARGLGIAAQGTGHQAARGGSLEGTLLVNTSGMREVEIDSRARRARVSAGVVWAEVSAAAAEHGLAALAGSSPDVGIVGYTLGGGLSWLARRYGLACNRVEAVELVTTSGEVVRCDHEQHAELFWAPRGGGGRFGVVTAIEFSLVPVSHVYAGAMFWPVERAGDVLGAWVEWTHTAPREVTSLGRILQVPVAPEVPEPLRGRSFAVVEAAFGGDEAAGARALSALRGLRPGIDTFATIPVEQLSRLHMDPDHPVPGTGDGMLLDTVTEETIGVLEAVAGAGSGSPLLSLELRHLGGALAEPESGHGALAGIEAAFAEYAVGITPDAAAKAAVGSHLDMISDALAPWQSRKAYANFADRPVDPARLVADGAGRRLEQIRAIYDPEHVMHTPMTPLDRSS
jgi:FAD binding domain